MAGKENERIAPNSKTKTSKGIDEGAKKISEIADDIIREATQNPKFFRRMLRTPRKGK